MLYVLYVLFRLGGFNLGTYCTVLYIILSCTGFNADVGHREQLELNLNCLNLNVRVIWTEVGPPGHSFPRLVTRTSS